MARAYKELEQQFPKNEVDEDDELKEIIFENFMLEDPIKKEIENFEDQTLYDELDDPSL